MDNTVGCYSIVRLIDRGGQGSVYLGYDFRLQRRVAIKVYRMPNRRKMRKALLQEARIIADIQSPRVVKIHDIVEAVSHLALVMEYVPGCSLEEYLSQVRPSVASTARVGLDIASALTLARRRRIVHGDIKASNVLIAPNGRAILTDFGIAAAVSGARSQQASLAALAPEQFFDDGVDERSDLFALGCLLYRMLTGEHPFYRNGRSDPKMLIEGRYCPLSDRVSDIVDVPVELVQLVDGLLQNNPRDRPKSARSVRLAMRSVLHNLPVSTRSSLLVEARPCFRRESRESRESREKLPAHRFRDPDLWMDSGLGVSGLMERVIRWICVFGVGARVTTAILALGVIGIALGVGSYQRVTPVRFSKPIIEFGGNAAVPDAVSTHWLLGQVKAVLDEQWGRTRIIGQVGEQLDATVYAKPWSSGRWAKLPQAIDVTLRCEGVVCVFAINRQQGSRAFRQQAVMLADTSLPQWRYAVRDATRSVLQ
ncbi:MAG: serine/threonine-protein kinase [Halioglobus sp.]|nr:serine/threonine-protein kinase [Halioglobus sp.]